MIMALGPVVAPEVAAQGSGPSSSTCQPRVPQWLCSWPRCVSPRPPRLAKGVRRQGEGHLALRHAGETPAAGRLSTAERLSASLERCSQLAQLRAPQEVAPHSAGSKRWDHYFENESCCHSGSGPESRGWVSGSSPGMRRCFHNINKK